LGDFMGLWVFSEGCEKKEKKKEEKTPGSS
jgi:hypothetical protein